MASKGRIRTIKPEFWRDGKILRVTNDCKLFFIGMWNFCDDQGKIQTDAAELGAQIPCIRNQDIPRHLTSLFRAGLIQRSKPSRPELAGKWTPDDWALIANWAHQKIDKPGKPSVDVASIEWIRDDAASRFDTSSDDSPPFEKGRSGSDRIGSEPPSTNSSPVLASLEQSKNSPRVGAVGAPAQQPGFKLKAPEIDPAILWIRALHAGAHLEWIRAGLQSASFPALTGRDRGVLRNVLKTHGEDDFRLGFGWLALALVQMHERYQERRSDFWLPTLINLTRRVAELTAGITPDAVFEFLREQIPMDPAEALSRVSDQLRRRRAKMAAPEASAPTEPIVPELDDQEIERLMAARMRQNNS